MSGGVPVPVAKKQLVDIGIGYNCRFEKIDVFESDFVRESIHFLDERRRDRARSKMVVRLREGCNDEPFACALVSQELKDITQSLELVG